jgi:hypothetical protein
MARITINGEAVEVLPRVRLDWGPLESQIRECLPAVALLQSERIALNAAWMARRVRLDEIAELEARLDEVKSEGNER